MSPIKIGNSHVTSSAPEWLCPIKHPPPPGKKLQLLTSGGIATYGPWSWEEGNIAWAPCLQIPPEIKSRIGHLPNWEKLRECLHAETAAPE